MRLPIGRPSACRRFAGGRLPLRTRIGVKPAQIGLSVQRDLASSLRQFDELVASGDLEPREQAEWWTKMIRAVYARITVVGTTFVEAQLTPAAYRHGLAVALPEAVQAEWRARPVKGTR
jgi:hypothetical protein